MISEVRKKPHRNAQALTAVNGAASETAPTSDKLEKLGFTKRESEVLQGKRNCEISVILTANQRTVEKHVQNILRKLSVETRTGATFAILRKVADPGFIARSSTELLQKKTHKR